jgi:ATP-dependent Clp endopeptidase proteolytic subunit ClpP
MSNWYSIQNKADESADVMIYDVIGWGVSADQFCRDLRAINAKTINVHMNTPGGSVFDGMAIYNSLKAHPANVVCHVEGLAASIGSVIALAGDEVRMGEGTFFMIHNPSSLAIGDADEMRRQADMLDKVSTSIAGIYVEKTGMTLDAAKAAMDAETWYTAEEAKAAGFADEIDEPDDDEDDPEPESATARAAFDFKIFALDHNRRRDFVTARLEPQAKQSNAEAKPPQKTPAARAVANPTPNQETPMSMTLDQFKAFAAANPDAVAPFIQQGATQARAELSKPATVNELKAAFPTHTGFIIDQLGANATMAQAKAAFADVLAADHVKALAVKDEELVQIKKVANIVTSGASALNTEQTPANPAAVALPDEKDPKAVAAWEWDTNPKCHKGYSTKERYVAVRSRELDGTFKVSSR